MRNTPTIDRNFDWLEINVISRQLCCGCGTCVGVCPTDAIDFKDYKYFPEWLDKDKCTDCGFCLDVCPGKGMPLDAAARELRAPQQEYNVDIGNYRKFLVGGYSRDEFIRGRSASGGIATSLLIYALDKKIVDKVIVVVNDVKEVARPVVKIADSEEDVLAAMQSKYIQVPLNKAIKEILKSDCRYGIVGLPCHLQGLYLAQKIYKKLSKQIIFRIGLFCGYSHPYELVDTFLKIMRLEKRDIETFIGWREGEYYPGRFCIKLKGGELASLSFRQWHHSSAIYYALLRCFLCIDGLSQLADISLGDTANPATKTTVIISRTEKGDKLLLSAKSEGYIDYTPVDAGTALAKGLIPFMLREKRYKVLSVIQHLARKNVSVPDWDIKEAKISRLDRVNGIWRLRLVTFVRKPAIAEFLKSHPTLFFAVGEFVYLFNIDPRAPALRVLTKLLQPHPRLMEWARVIYYHEFSPKRISSIFFRQVKEISPSKRGKTSSTKMSIGLVGVGGWGRQYVDILRRSDIFDLRVCFDTSEEILEKLCSSVGCLKANSLKELLTVDGLQAVAIVTPNHWHCEQCIRAIEQGKHVFVEKPIANMVEEAKKIYQAAEENNVIVSVGHDVRRRHEFRTMKKLIEDGKIGDVIVVEANNSQYIGEGEVSWRLSKDTCPGGPLLQLGIHHIDTLRYLFGEIVEVKAFSKEDYFEEVPDTVLSILFFKAGMLGYLGTSWATEPSFTMKVYGTEGNLILEGTTLYLQKNRKRKRIETRPVNTLEEEIKEFGECIMGKRKPEVDAKEATKNLTLVEAIMESIRKRGESVKIGEW